MAHISHFSWKVGDLCTSSIVDERDEIAAWCVAGSIMMLGSLVAIANYKTS